MSNNPESTWPGMITHEGYTYGTQQNHTERLGIYLGEHPVKRRRVAPCSPSCSIIKRKKEVFHVCLGESCQCIVSSRRKHWKHSVSSSSWVSVRLDMGYSDPVQLGNEANLHITNTLPSNKLTPFSSLALDEHFSESKSGDFPVILFYLLIILFFFILWSFCFLMFSCLLSLLMSQFQNPIKKKKSFFKIE